MWIARARKFHIALCFFWTFILVMDIRVDHGNLWISVPFFLLVWFLTYVSVRIEDHKKTHQNTDV